MQKLIIEYDFTIPDMFAVLGGSGGCLVQDYEWFNKTFTEWKEYTR